jgi:hypothetical protein
MQDEIVGADFELAAGGRAIASALDGGVLVRTLVNALGRQDRSFPNRPPEAIALAASQVVRKTLQPARGKVLIHIGKRN